MASRPQSTARPVPRLYLVTSQIADPAGFSDALSAALAAADVAAVLLRLADAGERTLINRIKALVPVGQAAGAAVLLHGHADLVAKSGADGAHLTGIDAFTGALEGLKPERIAGCGGLVTRHDAMVATESGADYVMFGEPAADGRRPGFDAILERVEWWAEVFEAPCVAFAASLDEIERLTAAGADFIAVGDCIWADARGPGAAVADASNRLALAEPAR